jgi:hypothetical protein
LRLNQPPVPLEQKMHLGAKRGAGFLIVEIPQERIIFAIEKLPRMKPFRKRPCKRGFSYANRAFHHNVARLLKYWLTHRVRL